MRVNATRRHRHNLRSPNRQSGQALAITTMAAVLLGVSFVAGLRYLGPKADLNRTAQTNTTISRVNSELVLFANRYGRLPCPDTNVTPGNEGACNSGPTWGLVPWKALGLSPSDVTDQWGRRLTYAVGKPDAAAGPGNASTMPYLCKSSGGLAAPVAINAVASPSSPAGSSGGSAANYLLIGHGPNGRGAFLGSGTVVGSQIASAPGTAEAYNCPRDMQGSSCQAAPDASAAGTEYWPGPFHLSSAGATWFDDTVAAKTLSQFQCLCTLPTITVGPVTKTTASATVLLPSPTGCNTVWAAGANPAATATFTQPNGSSQPGGSFPVISPGGIKPGPTATFTFASTTTISAQNTADAGWPTGTPPGVSPGAASPQTFNVILGSAVTTPGTGVATSVPAFSALNVGPVSSSDNTIASYTGDNKVIPTTQSPGSSGGGAGNTLAYTVGHYSPSYTTGCDTATPATCTWVVDYTVTFTGNGGTNGTGTLCYDGTYGTVGVLHTGSTPPAGSTFPCWIGSAGAGSGDTNSWLSISISGSASTYTNFSVGLYAYAAGQVWMEETASGSPVCSVNSTNDCSGVVLVPQTISNSPCVPATGPVATNGSAIFPSLIQGFNDLLQQSITQTVVSQNPPNMCVLGAATNPTFNTLVITTDASAQIGVGSLTASP